MNYLDLLKLAAPETILAITVLVVLMVDALAGRTVPVPARFRLGAGVAGLGCLAALFWLWQFPSAGRWAAGLLVADPLTRWVKIILLVLTLFTLLLSSESQFTRHVGEYFALLLLATIGLLFLVSAEHLLMMFLALELGSLSLYLLTAFNKDSPLSAEAALKYFLFGGVASAFMWFGLSLVYGLTGAVELRPIAAALQTQGLKPLQAASLVMIVIGFGFKIAAVPFHLWAPDTYQGAPVPCAALIASGSKVAGFMILAKVMLLGFAGVEGSAAWRHFAAGWLPLLATLAVCSMVLGNLAALAQNQVKRLLAYSAIAHAGYMLLGLLACGDPAQRQSSLAALLYYAATYALTALGAFGVVAVVEGGKGGSNLADFAGLSRRAPLPAWGMMVFLLSLAGVPPLAGFFGKFYVFAAAAGAGPQSLGLLWLVILAIALSVLSLYYYLQVLKQVFVRPPSPEAQPLTVPFALNLAIGLLALMVVGLGLMPETLLLGLLTAVQSSILI